MCHVYSTVKHMPEPELAPRRQPAQTRSRQRWDQILTAASELIAECGVEPISMTDIADRAGMGLPAVYRYFPNKRAIVRELALAMLEADAERLARWTTTPSSASTDAVAALVQEYWQLQLDQPARLQLRAAIRADAELATLDLADSRRNAAAIAQYVASVTGRSDLGVLERQALLLVELLGGLVSLVTQVPKPEAELLIADFASMFTCAFPSSTQTDRKQP